jgi:hypothetical protein
MILNGEKITRKTNLLTEAFPANITHYCRFLLALNPVYLLLGSGKAVLTLITMQLGKGFRDIFALDRPYIITKRFL